MKKILVVVAHPDDEVLGMGGTIAKLSAEGNCVHVLIVTDGSTSQYQNDKNISEIIERKKEETQNCANHLGVKSIIYGGLPDMKLDVTPHTAVNKVIEDAVNNLKPDVVYTHFWGDVNLDHQCVYKSVLVAVRPLQSQSVKELYCFRVPSSTEWSPCVTNVAFMPNTFVDIEKYSETKYKAIEAYKTELRSYPHPRSIEHIKIQDKATGLQVGREAAEAFVLLRKIEN